MAMDLDALSQQYPPRTVDTALGRIAYRRAGAGAPLVLLHGIGSGSGSWVRQLQALSGARDVLAWEAPGYGDSEPLDSPQPTAQDYGRRAWAWLDALGLTGPVTLAGHSLGALMAAAAAVLQPQRVQRLVLLSPAGGYGKSDPEVRDAKRRDRLANLATLGPQGLAQRRGAAMLSPHADAALVDYVKSIMGQVIPHGYTQATHMLANADLATLLAQVKCPVQVASGAADGITPAAGCRVLAEVVGAPYRSLGEVGHACALEAADAVNDLLLEGPAA